MPADREVIEHLAADMREETRDAPDAVVNVMDQFAVALRGNVACMNLSDEQIGAMLIVVGAMMLDPNNPVTTATGMGAMLGMIGQRIYDGMAP